MNKVRDFAEDLENWMAKLPQQHRQTPIINIAIPGSHDSFTGKITENSDVAPDAEKIIAELAVLGPIIKKVIANWSITQTYMAKEQLLRGIRYFDLRIATKDGTDNLYICHALYSIDVQSCLDEIKEFLDEHPQEVVILDFQHFYGLDDNIHKSFIQSINTTFGNKIAPNTLKINEITIDSLTQSKYQVIIIYRINSSPFWSSEIFPNPWPNTISHSDLILSLNNGLANRNQNIPFISQCVLTPDAEYILQHVLSNLKEKCAIELEIDRSNWIKNQKAGAGGLNIIIADFIELTDNQYVKNVINVNQTINKQ